MAQAATAMPENDVPLIEEQVETGLRALLDGYKTSYAPGGEKPDDLMGRFTLYPSRSLPEYDHAYAKAYEARDDFNELRQVYALVCDNSVPMRQQALTELTAFIHPNLTTLLGAGTVKCSHLGESRMVIFIEKPAGLRLSEVMKQQPRFHEHRVIDHVLGPAIKALLSLREKKLCHGQIHPHNFFLSETSQLGECVSAPTGTLNHHIYEPLERLMAMPLGRGEATEAGDVYSLAILAYELMYGLDKIKSIPRETFIERAISMGIYQIFSQNREFSDTFQDFFRGILNDSPAERWGLDQLNQWINGKRFNMIAPSAPKEGARPLMFMNEEYLSRRMLAHKFHLHWRQAIKDIKSLKLDRWCETSLHRPELGEKLDRTMRFAGGGSTDIQLSDMMTRVICVLDPVGPLRSHLLSLRPDGIGQVLADVLPHNGPELAQLTGFIEGDLGSYWTEQDEGNKTTEMSVTIFRLQKVKGFLKKKSIGFGIERALYDLNPSLCCQSDILKPYHVTTTQDALKTLDAIASKQAPHTSFADKHIAAFIASKIDTAKEVRIHELEGIPALAKNEELVVLSLLAKAQQKNQKMPLVGLCAWAGMRIEKMIDEIHNRVIRKRLKLTLKKLALSGSLYEILTAIINTDVSFRDGDGFAKAIALHQINHQRIEIFKNPAVLDYKSKRAGGKMAMTICYVALAVTSYITLTRVYGI